MKQRITSIDLLRGLVIMLMALDHVRIYFGYGTWYSEPTNLSATTPLLFFTRWITHFCAPAFVFLAGASAYLYGSKKSSKHELSRFLLTRGLWLIFVELVIVNFAWTFDITYSFRLLQVIWAIGISMVALAAFVYLPTNVIAVIGLILVFGHNTLDSINTNGNALPDLLWYTLHQSKFLILASGNVINFVYPILPWIGVMALGYTLGKIYEQNFDSETRRSRLLQIGTGLVLLFFFLRAFNLYGEPKAWSGQSSFIFSVMSFLNLTKYPPSLQFLLMTLGPALIFLSVSEQYISSIFKPVIVFGKVPFFFYVVHLYFIHALAAIFLDLNGYDCRWYILSAENLLSGRLGSFGVGIEAVYFIWILVVAMIYPLCRWYQSYKLRHPEKRWLSYL